MEVNAIVHIGKESNDLDIAQIISVQGDETVVYASNDEELERNKDMILQIKPAQINAFGIYPRTWLYIQRVLKTGRIPKVKDKTTRKIRDFLQSSLAISSKRSINCHNS